MFEITAIAIAILAFALVSNRLRDSILTAPIVMMLAGLAIAWLAGTHTLMKIDHSAIHLLAEITLVLILFSDAARIDIRTLWQDHNLPVRGLLPPSLPPWRSMANNPESPPWRVPFRPTPRAFDRRWGTSGSTSIRSTTSSRREHLRRTATPGWSKRPTPPQPARPRPRSCRFHSHDEE